MQPEPPPATSGGALAPTTPFVRSTAAARGIDLRSVRGSGPRITVADLDRHFASTGKMPHAGEIATGSAVHSLSAEVDVTQLIGLDDTPLAAAVAVAFVSALRGHAAPTGAREVALDVIRVRSGPGEARVTRIDAAHDLSRDGIARVLAAETAPRTTGKETGEGRYRLVDLTGTGIVQGLVSALAEASVGVVLGDAVRRVVPVVDASGSELIALRSLVWLTLVYDPGVIDVGAAAALLHSVEQHLTPADRKFPC